MPELPEVETIARGLAKRVAGDVIDSVWLGQKKEPLKSPAQAIASTREQGRIVDVRRMGKHIGFDLETNHVARVPLPARRRAAHRKPKTSGRGTSSKAQREAGGGDRSLHSNKAQWIVHLGMTGRLQVSDPQSEIEKHTHAILKLASGRELRFVDPRRFGRLSVIATGDFEAGGLEPLDVALEPFVNLFRGRKTPIKSALLNQKLLRGVGNIYADESLFRAGIRPRRWVSPIPRAQLEKLYESVQEVLEEAIAMGGSSVSDYVDADGEAGFFQVEDRVYGRDR